ncbi:ATP-binding cassette domain-containing protein [Subtercola vilae]|uniref:Sugar ABC transporter ATP-binding protein n=1 Tax=Subtercola vilae TaxID=2056433 RepID=A0A4T2C2X0_9MICO|nr:ATP-binding cassette domain-containing protein [Subtercola vilae]TIH38320.1 sugar ABC transporter ATP-binding protein [Subtercola vilae]
MPVSGLALHLSSVSARSSPGTGIRAVSFAVPAGAVHGILAENLSGASEVLAVIGGFLPVTEGVLRIGGEPRRFDGYRAAETLGVRVLRGEPAIVPHTSVAENIFLGHEKSVGGFIRFDRLNANAAELLTRFGLGATVDPRSPGSGLSRAERQVVELVRCVVAQRTVVLIDEPFTGLDAAGLALVAAGIRRLSAEGVTVVVATHRIDMLTQVAQNVSVLSRGEVVETVSMLEGRPSEARLIEHMTANIRVSPRPLHETREAGPVVFEIAGWSAYHVVDSDTAVVRDVSLNARRGEIVGLAGLAGSGIAELALSLFARSYSSSVTGTMLVNGSPLVAETPQQSVAGGVGLSTSANLRYDLKLLGGIPSRVSPSLLGRLARFGLVDRHRDYETASPAFGLGGISALVGNRAAAAAAADGGWSAGARRHVDALKLWLDQPLEARPVVVVLDHPTASLEGEQLHAVRDLIVELATGGTAVLLASDNLDELLIMTNRIFTLAEGRVTAELVTRQATAPSVLAGMIGRTSSS